MDIARNSVVLFLLPKQQKNNDAESVLHHQKTLLTRYLRENPGVRLIADFYENVGTQKNKNKWLKARESMALCLDRGYELIIPEIKQYHAHPTFSKLLTEFFKNPETSIKISCLDQPFIDKMNLLQVIEHLKRSRERHGVLIKQGLTKSQARSGNPKASEVIQRVNRPKILFSILFSLIIEPVVQHMETQRFSQRKMVDFLNQNSFYAPEGGKWVLSQFQKVYDRVKLNRITFALKHRLNASLEQPDILEKFLADLNLAASHLLSSQKSWTKELVLAAQTRLADLKELSHLITAQKILHGVSRNTSTEDLSVDMLMQHSWVQDLLTQAFPQQEQARKWA